MHTLEDLRTFLPTTVAPIRSTMFANTAFTGIGENSGRLDTFNMNGGELIIEREYLILIDFQVADGSITAIAKSGIVSRDFDVTNAGRMAVFLKPPTMSLSSLNIAMMVRRRRTGDKLDCHGIASKTVDVRPTVS